MLGRLLLNLGSNLLFIEQTADFQGCPILSSGSLERLVVKRDAARLPQFRNAATELFLTYGYHAISTKKIAVKAGVSEALVFRHFVNKEGLLLTLLDLENENISRILNPIYDEQDPKALLRRVIKLAFSDDHRKHLKFSIKMKWELKLTDDIILSATRDALFQSFSKLRFKQPDLETDLLLCMIEGIISNSLTKTEKDYRHLEELLIRKYHLNQ